MPDSGKFKDLYLNSAHTYPCQPGTDHVVSPYSKTPLGTIFDSCLGWMGI